MDQEAQIVRAVLTEWAAWLIRGSGYPRRSAIAALIDGGGGGSIFVSKPPVGSLPHASIETALRAMKRLRESDRLAAGILESWYLREKNETAGFIARRLEINREEYVAIRRSAERKFGACFFHELRENR